MYSGRDGIAALPYFDEFDLSAIDVLLISQYVNFLANLAGNLVFVRGFCGATASIATKGEPCNIQKKKKKKGYGRWTCMHTGKTGS